MEKDNKKIVLIISNIINSYRGEKMEKISVIVPIYNVEKYLRVCVDSIINQTYKNLEIILVDDESPDNCPAICDEYKEKDNRIKVIHQKNKGLSGARNSGIDISTGKYLVFLDSDDYLELDAIEILYNSLKQYNVKISICGRNYVFENNKKICKIKESVEKKYNFEEAIEEMNKFYYFDMSAWGKLYSRDLFDNIRFPVGKLSEDYFVMYKLFKNANQVSYTSAPLYNYLQRQNSISRNKKINEDFIEAARNQMNDLENISENLKIITHVAYASSMLTVTDFYIKQKVNCPKNKIKYFRQDIINNYKFIKKYKCLSKAKRIQFKLFITNYNLYKVVFSFYRKIKKV